MKKLLNSNEWQYRLLRTIIQGLIGVIIANLDLVISFVHISPDIKPMIVAFIMCILSPIMAMLKGEKDE